MRKLIINVPSNEKILPRMSDDSDHFSNIEICGILEIMQKELGFLIAEALIKSNEQLKEKDGEGIVGAQEKLQKAIDEKERIHDYS